MLSLIYANSKKGQHGYLKLTMARELKDNEFEFIRGPEIHFRTKLPLVVSFARALGSSIEHEGRPLAVQLKNKPRKKELLDIIPLKTGHVREMRPLWEVLTQKAKVISKEEPRMNGTETNCHTLTFRLLEEVQLTAPRDQYRERIKSGVFPARHPAPAHG